MRLLALYLLAILYVLNYIFTGFHQLLLYAITVHNVCKIYQSQLHFLLLMVVLLFMLDEPFIKLIIHTSLRLEKVTVKNSLIRGVQNALKFLFCQ